MQIPIWANTVNDFGLYTYLGEFENYLKLSSVEYSLSHLWLQALKFRHNWSGSEYALRYLQKINCLYEFRKTLVCIL